MLKVTDVSPVLAELEDQSGNIESNAIEVLIMLLTMSLYHLLLVHVCRLMIPFMASLVI